jgi:hypothetical protein
VTSLNLFEWCTAFNSTKVISFQRAWRPRVYRCPRPIELLKSSPFWG